MIGAKLAQLVKSQPELFPEVEAQQEALAA